jgi:hypothetical protein
MGAGGICLTFVGQIRPTEFPLTSMSKKNPAPPSPAASTAARPPLRAPRGNESAAVEHCTRSPLLAAHRPPRRPARVLERSQPPPLPPHYWRRLEGRRGGRCPHCPVVHQDSKNLHLHLHYSYGLWIVVGCIYLSDCWLKKLLFAVIID